jgi:uncharacterized protein (DUF58 family)
MHDGRLLLMVGTALLFARLSEGRLPYFFFYMTATLVLFGWLWMRQVLRKLDCIIQVDREQVEVGQDLNVRVRLDNDMMLPVPWVEVDDETSQRLVRTDSPRQATALPLLGARILHFRSTARRRGHYHVGPIRVRMGDPFGFFRGIREFTSRLWITVYPRVHRIEQLPIPLSQPFGPVRTREKAFEDPSNQAEIRPYRPGDNPRHIHWKTTARLGDLMLREYELNATTQMILFPDLSEEAQAASGDLSTEETVVELTASLANLGLRRKIDVGLITHGQDRYQIVQTRGERSFTQILEVLARVEARGRLPIARVLERETAHLSGRSTLVVMTPVLTGHLADVLIRLRARHQVMLVLLAREAFAGAGEPAPPDRVSLTGLLLMRRVSVYLVSGSDEISRLADLRLTAGSFREGGRQLWTSGSYAHPL